MQRTQPLRLLIVEWHPILSDQLRNSLARDPGLTVVGHVATAVEATRLVRSQPVDLVLCEAGLPDPGAAELARFFRLRMPGTVVAIMARMASQDELFEAARVGAAAYLRTGMDDRSFVATLLRAGHGEFPIDEEVVRQPAVASRILSQFRRTATDEAGKTGESAPVSVAEPPADSTRLAPLFVPLSGREIEILDLVARGNSNKLIARQLQISDQTVKNHVSAILRKLEVNDRTEAVVYALRNGWIRIDAPARVTP